MKTCVSIILSLLFIVGFLVGCGETGLEEEGVSTYYVVAGQVKANGVPIEGATVKIQNSDYQYESVTGEQGIFTFKLSEEIALDPDAFVHTEVYIGESLIAVTAIRFQGWTHINLEEFEPIQGFEVTDNEETGELATDTQALTNPVCVQRVVRRALRYYDPLNHCYASCELRRNCGTSIYGTILLGYAKEICDILNWTEYCHDFSVGDLWADFMGLSCSYQTWQSCYNCCR